MTAAMRPYHLPPAGYSSPSFDPGCGECSQPVIFVGVVAGEKWVHLIRPAQPHDVTMPEPWWDVVTGQFIDGNPLPIDRQSAA